MFQLLPQDPGFSRELAEFTWLVRQYGSYLRYFLCVANLWFCHVEITLGSPKLLWILILVPEEQLAVCGLLKERLERKCSFQDFVYAFLGFRSKAIQVSNRLHSISSEWLSVQVPLWRVIAPVQLSWYSFF